VSKAPAPRSTVRTSSRSTREAGISVMRSTASERRSVTHTCTRCATGAKTAVGAVVESMRGITP